MFRSTLSLVLASVAALSIGVIGGKMILSKPQARAAASASLLVTTSAPSADEPLRTATPAPSRAPVSSQPPAKVAAAPAPAATPAPAGTPAPAKTSGAEPDDDLGIGEKPNIRFNPDENEVTIEGGGGGFTISKEKISVRTPFGEFGLDF
jgi:hypothetical protein